MAGDGASKHQLATEGSHAGQHSEQRAEAHPVEHRDALEVDREAAVAVAGEPDEPVVEPRGGRDVDLARDDHDLPVVLRVHLDRQIHECLTVTAHPGGRMGEMFEDLLESLACEGQLVHVEQQPARPSRMGLLVDPLSDEVWKRLGIDALWCHQAEAMNLLGGGESVVVATGTASGKSLVLPGRRSPRRWPASTRHPRCSCSRRRRWRRTSCARSRRRASPASSRRPTTATPRRRARAWVRRHANVVLTNPEMLHVGILPFHGRWATFLRRLRYVVIDELHVFRGIFGTHVAHLLRRLRRLCARYGASPTFIFSSATIGEPAALASALCGLPVRAVTDDGSPRGERLFALWNPPLLDADTGARGVTNVEAAVLTAALLEDGARTVAFCRSRKATEVVAGAVRRKLDADLASRVRSYRGGYLPSERREIETELFDGQLAGVVATTALELGIDVGGLDACVHRRLPGHRRVDVAAGGPGRAHDATFAGRARRRRRPARPVADGPPARGVHPPARAGGREPLEPVRAAAPSRVRRLRAAALARRRAVVGRRPRRRRAPARARRPARAAQPARGLERAGRAGAGHRPALGLGRGVPHRRGRRSARRHRRRSPAFEPVHPGAIYLHQGQTYRVVSLDLDDRAAIVEPVDDDEYTQVRSETNVADPRRPSDAHDRPRAAAPRRRWR